VSFPIGGSGSADGGQWGLGADGSIPGMAGRNQSNMTDAMVSDIESNTIWSNLNGGLIGMILSLIGGAIATLLNGFANLIDAITGTVNNAYIQALPVITDHSQSITELREAFDQLVLQGEAKVFTSNNTYVPSPGILSVDVIIIGAGGGGGSGSYDFAVSGARSGGGGSGGGETHTSVPASLLPTNPDGSFKPIQIVIGAGGAGAASDSGFGTGGGNSKFGPEVGNAGQQWLLGGGGVGGAWGAPGPVAQGGVGMIPGGNGGRGGYSNVAPTAPTSSVSAYGLYGGGGGGGAGGGAVVGTAGAAGGISPGGGVGNPGSPGQSPSEIVATGGGGGGGGVSGSAGGGAGAYPGGGGGGSACGVGGATFGGPGANGIIYVIERMT
jgi:hypothetical protein